MRITLCLLVLVLAGLGWAVEPGKKRPTDQERGQELYVRHCEACHGAFNRGKGPATEALVHPVPDLQGKLQVDDAMIQLVLRGKGAMPGYEQTFDRFDAKRVLDHMARLTDPDPTAAPAPTPPAEPTPEAPAAEPEGAEVD